MSDALFVALSFGFLISSLGTTQMALLVREMQFQRLELRQIAATLVGRLYRHRPRRDGPGSVGDRRPAAGRGRHLDGHSSGAVTVAASLRFSTGKPATARRFRGQRLCGERHLAGGTEARQRPDRPVPRSGRARHLHAGDDRHPDAVRPHRGAAAAGLLPRLLAHQRRPRADGGHLDPRDAPRWSALDSVARRPRHRRARLRRGRPRIDSGTTRRTSSRSLLSSESSSLCTR